MKYHLVSVGILVGTASFYMAGFAGAGVAFLACGVALEIGFWMRRATRRQIAAQLNR
jgi:hypothetical protein